VGFGSGEAFTRAFRAFFGCSPTAWRRQRAERLRAKRNAGQVGRNPGQDDPAQGGQHEGPQHAEPEIVMNVQVLDLPPTRIGYLRRVGPYGPGVAAFWQAEVYPWMVAHRLLEQPRYGISQDDRPWCLLGEVHDNAAQHALRLRAFEALLATGARPALAMEQFDRNRQPRSTACWPARRGPTPTP
jgi:hypothetical protein